MKKIWASIAIFVAVAGMLFVVDKPNENCVNLYVDYGVLDDGTKITKCIEVSNNTVALDILKKANLEIEGTKKYGLGVVCRVNGLPDEKAESCETMPPAEAYWAIIIKEKQKIPLPLNEWGWGQLAVDQQILNQGDSIGLVWTGPTGELKFP
jgi:hypothetical protein